MFLGPLKLYKIGLGTAMRATKFTKVFSLESFPLYGTYMFPTFSFSLSFSFSSRGG